CRPTLSEIARRAGSAPHGSMHTSLAMRQRTLDERVHGRIVGLTAAEQRDLRYWKDSLRYVQLAHAVGARASRQLGALRVLTSRHEDQLLTLLKIGEAHAGMLRLRPGAGRELLDGRQRNHLA